MAPLLGKRVVPSRRLAASLAALTGILGFAACRDMASPHRLSPADHASFLLHPNGTVVVAPTAMQGWMFYDDQHDTTCTVATVCQMVGGPAGQPAGTGSAELATPVASDGKALVLADYAGTRFDSITDLHYSTYRQTADAGNNLAIALQFNVDYDLTDAVTSYMGRIVFEPYQGVGGNVPQSTWQTWDAKAGKWWGTKSSVTKAGVSVTNPCIHATPCTWAQLLSIFPNVGVHATLGAVVLKAGSGWAGFRGNVDKLTIGANGTTTTYDFEVSATAPPHLSVIMEPGVREANGLVDQSVAAGTVISYNFRALPGRTNVLVMLDSTLAPAQGTVTMDHDHTLIVGADSLVILTPDEQTIASDLRAVMTSADHVGAYQHFINTSYAYIRQVGSTDRMDAIEYAAIDLVADSAALDLTDAALGGHLFRIDSGGFAAAAKAPVRHLGGVWRATASGSMMLPDSLEPTNFIFVNGIYNYWWDASKTTGNIATIIRAQPLFADWSRFGVGLLYNRSILAGPMSAADKKRRCTASMLRRSQFLSFWKARTYYGNCLNDNATTEDVGEAIDELVSHIQTTGPSFPGDAAALADTFDLFRSQGWHTVVIAHSQGNLIMQQALVEFRAPNGYNFREAHDSTCVATVALAAPTSRDWQSPVDRVKGIVVRGDLVADNTVNSWPRITSTRTAEYLDDLGKSSESLNPFTRAYWAVKAGIVAFHLHLVNESYLTPLNVRGAVSDSILSSYRECAMGEVKPAFSGETVIPGGGRNLTPYTDLFNQNGATRSNQRATLSGRVLTWYSSDPTVATVSPTGDVRGVSPGVAQIWARSWADSGFFTYTVVPPPNPLTGHYVGTWIAVDGATTHVADLHLVQNGFSVSGTLQYESEGVTYSNSLISGTTGVDGLIVNVLAHAPEADAAGRLCIPGNVCTQLLTLGTTQAHKVLSGASVAGNNGTDPVIGRHWSLTRVTP